MREGIESGRRMDKVGRERGDMDRRVGGIGGGNRGGKR